MIACWQLSVVDDDTALCRGLDADDRRTLLHAPGHDAAAVRRAGERVGQGDGERPPVSTPRQTGDHQRATRVCINIRFLTPSSLRHKQPSLKLWAQFCIVGWENPLKKINFLDDYWAYLSVLRLGNVLRELHKYLGLFEGTFPKRFSFIAQTQNFIVDFKSTTQIHFLEDRNISVNFNVHNFLCGVAKDTNLVFAP